MLAGRSAKLRLIALVIVGEFLWVGAAAANQRVASSEGGGEVVAWGENQHGQLGAIYNDMWEERPIPVEDQSGVVEVADGGSFSLTRFANGKVAASGSGRYGMLGYGGRKASWELGRSHVAVSDLSGVSEIAAAKQHAIALLDDGTVKAWGNNAFGTLGNGTGGFEQETGESQLLPKTVGGLRGVIAVAAGEGADFAVLSNHTLMAWGNNDRGQLGIGETGPDECITESGPEPCSTRPRQVLGASGLPLKNVVAVTGGEESAYALLTDGHVMSWGANSRGQLGTGGPTLHSENAPAAEVLLQGPHGVEPLSRVAAIAGGFAHALALLEDGTVVGWGDNDEGALGELGREACNRRDACDALATPIAAFAGLRPEAISAGTGYSLVLAGGRVYTLGTNRFGTLGAGAGCENTHGEMGQHGTCYSRTAVAIPGLEHVSAISAGDSHASAVLEHGVTGPSPQVTVEAGGRSLALAWTLAGEQGEQLLYRAFERPAESEAPEEEESEAPEEEEEPEEGGQAPATGEGAGALAGDGRAPENATLPTILVFETSGEELKRVKGETREGQVLEATTGHWAGTAPITYRYQWRRCRSSSCASVAGAKRARYQLAEADVGSTLEVTVTASNGVAPAASATSEPSEVVKSGEEGARAPAEKITLGAGEESLLLERLGGQPVEAIPYELKLTSGNGAGSAKKRRVFVATPLP